ncbi:MAG: polyphosphate kinase 1 [Puniceicoccaceae bacterium]
MAAPKPPTTLDHHPSQYPFFNREISWLSFNRRVLEQALNPDFPLLERLKFLGFVASNLDEFYEIRVAGLLQQVASGISTPTPDGLTPSTQLERVLELSKKLVLDQYQTWRKVLQPALREEGIVFHSINEVDPAQMRWLTRYFEREVFPVLTPLGTDPSHPFPFLANKSLNLLVLLQNPLLEAEPLLAILPVPRILPRIIRIDTPRKQGTSLVFLSDLIGHFADRLFPGYQILSTHPFRVTRNSDLYIDEEEVENLLRTIQEQLLKVKKGAAVRLEISHQVSPSALSRLLQAIDLPPENVFPIEGPLNLLRLMTAYELIDRPDLKFPPDPPRHDPAFADRSQIFAQIADQDRLLHHPFTSFKAFEDFITEASRDPAVFAIKQTLYRTSGDSPIIAALIEASRLGKQVTALVELKARFDEANNIAWAKQLEEAGVHVVYGLVGLKTHCKCCLVVRREGKILRRYAHLGTGNYNSKTARLYTDFSFFTSQPAITSEVAALFNTLTGFASSPQFKTLLVAPFNLQARFLEFIRTETRHALAGHPAHIIVKVNSLIDQETILALYQASQAGVKVDLIIRGICGLVPGIKGFSENIRVRSILGRYLEHSRVYYFLNHGQTARLYLGSADWMPRNFFRRIEAVVPIEQPRQREEILSTLQLYLRDNKFAKQLRPNGRYTKVPRARQKPEVSVQDLLALQNAPDSQDANAHPPRTVGAAS